MKSENLVSVITATFNSEEWIKQTYDSLLSQTYDNWEWLVTDDCSTDETFAILTRLSFSDKRIRVFQNKVNSGAAVSRNNSIVHAKGSYVAFLDSDDVWFSEKLDKQIKYMYDNKLVFTYTAYELIDENNKEIGKLIDLNDVNHVSYDEMLRKKSTLGCSTVIIKNGHFEDMAMPLIRTGQDYAFWLKLLKQDILAYKLNMVLTKYRISPNSISRNKLKKSLRQWEIYRRIEKLSFFKSVVCWLFYAFRAAFR
ncbi:glycosyltransferase [Vibrio owensii]|uniref:glycosyltransferase family 2 protein n=1 Tax=Vibrio owensii TaxID=696485 RepID=UPI002F40B1BB